MGVKKLTLEAYQSKNFDVTPKTLTGIFRPSHAEEISKKLYKLPQEDIAEE